jgi:hypothetical protein
MSCQFLELFVCLCVCEIVCPVLHADVNYSRRMKDESKLWMFLMRKSLAEGCTMLVTKADDEIPVFR